MNIEELKKENEELKRKLLSAKLWMEREIKVQITKITKGNIKKMTLQMKDNFFWDNVEEIITKKIIGFFWEILLLNIPSSVIDNIVSAEISYYNLKENPNFDGLSVISSYHKALDALIEMFIIKWFRKFAHKTWQTILRKNDTLEKSLNSVVNKWYILSAWRLYHLLFLIKEWNELFEYSKCFKEYLEKYEFLAETLLNDEFISCFKKIVETEILGKKRHVWKIDFEETRKARRLIIWDFEDKNCLIFKLIKTQEIGF